MAIIIVSPMPRGNTGVVPPWLRPTTGGPGEDTRGPFDPFGFGDREDPTGGMSPDEIAREQQRSEALVDDVRSYFKQLGVTDAEGADLAHKIDFDPTFPNAAYIPKDEHGVADEVRIGVDPATGRSFNDSPDVIAHEWTHRMVDHITHGKLSLSPLSEDVAVHESLADTFAAAYDTKNWTIGEGVGEVIRDMANPERLGHPGTVDELERVFAPGSPFVHPIDLQNGDVLRDKRGKVVKVPDWHVVAGIPNKAAYLIGSQLGREEMAQIYLQAVRKHLVPGTEIEGLAKAVMQSSDDMFGAGSKESQVVRDAWDAVGVLKLTEPQVATEQPELTEQQQGR